MEEIEGKNWVGTLKTIFMAIFLVVFMGAGMRLFWPEETQKVVDYAEDLLGLNVEIERNSDLLTVIYPDEAQNLSPFSLNFAVRQRLNNIYDPLVMLDPDLKPYGGLAISWGMVDDLTWHFNLRPEVTFQNGSSFEAMDVVRTFELAQSSELAPILNSIESVEKINDQKVEIKTYKPDPLLVQRVAKVLIVPSEWQAGETMGTGPYKLSKLEPGQYLDLQRNEAYWAGPAFYKKVKILSIIEKSKRVNTFLTGTVDLLSFVSYDAAKIVEERGFKLTAVPSLEVQFLLFNLKSDFFSHLEARKAVNMAIDKEVLVKSVGGYAKAVKQFVSSGVFGFNSSIEGYEYDLAEAKELITTANLANQTVQLHLQKGLDVIGEHIRKQLAGAGVNVLVSYLEPTALEKSIKNREADMYFLGFKSDFADAMDLYSALFDSKSLDNISSYESEEFDAILSEAMKELKPEVRISYLKEAMKVITDKDVVGVPLFEYENLYGFKKDLDFKPRIDGAIHFNELN